jgi:Zn-dependent protease with chaperone function
VLNGCLFAMWFLINEEPVRQKVAGFMLTLTLFLLTEKVSAQTVVNTDSLCRQAQKPSFMGTFGMIAPLVEFFGFLFFILLASLGYVNWLYTLSFLALSYSFAIMYSVFANLFEELSYQQYKHPLQMLKISICGSSGTYFLSSVNRMDSSKR